MSDAEDIVFDADRAQHYDAQRAKLAPMRDALHLLTGLVLSDRPDDARVLVVGAGTGAELLALAAAHPAWRFTLVDPAEPMLAVCRQRAAQAGIEARCTFHAGYLDSLPAGPPFHAATCFLVSHFLTDPDRRRALFEAIAARLAPGGVMVSADLAGDLEAPASAELLEVWLRMLAFTGMPAAEIEGMRASFGRAVAVRPPAEVAALMGRAGFTPPVLFCQTLFIHAWFARRAR
jgi:tRNA (cmo5U34)-methyltransferase